MDNPISVLHSGNTGSFRWRGPRQSAPLISYIESLIQDIASIDRRALRTTPNPATQILLPSEPLLPGIYDLGIADPRNDPWCEGLNDLGSIVIQLNTIRIQSLRTQMSILSGG